jgi:hypothetical protein
MDFTLPHQTRDDVEDECRMISVTHSGLKIQEVRRKHICAYEHEDMERDGTPDGCHAHMFQEG